MTSSAFLRGIHQNRGQVAHQLIQVMLVGFAIGMTRTVVPALAESEFGLERGSFLLLASFVVAFGGVKAVMNFVAGRWSEHIGRKRVLFWGGSQLFTGRLSDHVGRFWPNVLGMWICGAGVAMVVMGTGVLWWSVSAGVAGFGMALLYPNLSAAVADITPPAWRGTAIGIFRFWRDLGYAIGALGLGLAACLTGAVEAAFWFVAISMFVPGSLLVWLSEETHPQLNPAP